jgi:chloramphenicol O-acetyltransferase
MGLTTKEYIMIIIGNCKKIQDQLFIIQNFKFLTKQNSDYVKDTFTLMGKTDDIIKKVCVNCNKDEEDFVKEKMIDIQKMMDIIVPLAKEVSMYVKTLKMI